jgi:very-short-patch-repair endonuclease
MPQRAGPRAKINAVLLARQQRRQLTPPEYKLWQVLRQRPGGLRFRRQHPIGDKLSLDFFCNAAALAIEVDGEAHERGDRPVRDARRDAWVASVGIETLRIPAQEVFRNLEGVVQAIVTRAAERLAPPPLAQGRERSPPQAS